MLVKFVSRLASTREAPLYGFAIAYLLTPIMSRAGEGHPRPVAASDKKELEARSARCGCSILLTEAAVIFLATQG